MVDWSRGAGSACHTTDAVQLSSMDLWSIGGGGRAQSVMKIILCNSL